MRLSGKRFADKYVSKKMRPTSETRDAIIFEVDWTAYVCKCKIQGSNEYVNAYFPRNEATIPSWMKPGNAVRILHRTGVRGHTEVIGHGGAIPTPMPGGAWRPETSALADGVLTGCEMTVVEGTLSVRISEGTYRISGSSYSVDLDAIDPEYMGISSLGIMTDDYVMMTMGGVGASEYTVMDDGTTEFMTESNPVEMGVLSEGLYTIDAPPSEGYFRYDAFVVGIDGVVDYLKGTAASSNPTKPSVPSGHILLGEYIFVVGGIAELEDKYLGLEWTARAAASIAIDAFASDEWEFDLGNDYPTLNVVVRAYDQYGWAISLGETVTLQLIGGSGLVYSAQSGYGTSVDQYVGGSSYTFVYQRDQTGTETSPSFFATSDSFASNLAHITLLDVLGNPVTGTQFDPSVIQTPTSAAAIAIDWSKGERTKVTAEEDITFSFSGAISFDKLILEITQDGIGGWEMTWPSNIRYGANITEITISTEPNSTSYVGFIYCASAAKYDVVANQWGYGA